MPKAKAQLSWEPIHRGNVYCAQACGHGCTYTEYLRAHAGAADLVSTLGAADGWKVRVWENMGWYYCVVDASGTLKVYPPLFGAKYSAFLGSGDVGGRWSADGKTPALAVKRVLAIASDERDTIDAMLRAIPNARRLGAR